MIEIVILTLADLIANANIFWARSAFIFPIRQCFQIGQFLLKSLAFSESFFGCSENTPVSEACFF